MKVAPTKTDLNAPNISNVLVHTFSLHQQKQLHILLNSPVLKDTDIGKRSGFVEVVRMIN